MPSNKVWVECTHCGRRKELLKFYRACGWYTKGLHATDLTRWLEWHKHDRFSDYGEKDFTFVYETDPGFLLTQQDLEERKDGTA